MVHTADFKIMVDHENSVFIINSDEKVIEFDSDLRVISTTPGVPSFRCCMNRLACGISNFYSLDDEDMLVTFNPVSKQVEVRKVI